MPTEIDNDDDDVAEAMRLTSPKSEKGTVNLRVREFSALHGRAAALEHYAALAARWDFEGWEQRRFE